jgi:RHS repeat-associated protein
MLLFFCKYSSGAIGRRVSKQVTAHQGFFGCSSRNDLIFTQSYSYLIDQDKILLAKAEDGTVNLYLDSESGNYYNRTRMYSPLQGRFTTTDPIGYLGDSTNLYRYAKNNGAKSADSSGKGPVTIQASNDETFKITLRGKHDTLPASTARVEVKVSGASHFNF